MEAFMSVSRSLLAMLVLLMWPLEQSAAQRRTPSGISRDTSAADSSAVVVRVKRQCAYDLIMMGMVQGAGLGLLTYLPIPPEWNRLNDAPVPITLLVTSALGAYGGYTKAKRLGCFDRSSALPQRRPHELQSASDSSRRRTSEPIAVRPRPIVHQP
jgi:hypothetical protein